jgi:hypothetical protein
MLVTPAIEKQPTPTFEAGLFQMRAGVARDAKKRWVMPLSVVIDPKIEFAAGTARVKLLEAIDEKGNDLLTTDDHTTGLYPSMKAVFTTSLTQLRPDNMGTRIAKLRGVMTGMVVVQRTDWEIPLDQQPHEKTFERDGITNTLSVDAVEPGEKPDRFDVQLARVQQLLIHPRFWDTVQLRQNEAYNQSLFSDVHLFDGQGREFFLQKTDIDSEQDERTLVRSWTGTFGRVPREGTTATATADAEPPQGAPTKLSWSLPNDVRLIEVPFEFHDIAFAQTP